jgi:hypothetical protein
LNLLSSFRGLPSATNKALAASAVTSIDTTSSRLALESAYEAPAVPRTDDSAHSASEPGGPNGTFSVS